MAYLYPYCTGLWTWNADYVVVEMTSHDRDKIIAAAKVAGCHPAYLGSFYSSTEALERFYAIAFEAGRQAERAECAKVCEMEAGDPHNLPAAIVARRCSDAIRARGEGK